MASTSTTLPPSDLPSLSSTVAGTPTSSSMPASPTSPAPSPNPQIKHENGESDLPNGIMKEALADVVDDVKDELIAEGDSDPDVSCRIQMRGRRSHEQYESR